MEIAIGTTNKAKIQAVQAIVNQYFEKVNFTYFKAASQVSEQPLTTEETRLGYHQSGEKYSPCDRCSTILWT